MPILTEVVASSQKNVTIRLSGTIDDHKGGWIEVPTNQTHLKLNSIVWLIEEKMGFLLSWDKDSVLMPLESRNNLRFDHSIPCPAKWQGSVWLKPFKTVTPPMAFLLILDFDK